MLIIWNRNQIPPNPRQALLVLRIVWAALLLGQVIFFCVIPAIWKVQNPPAKGFNDTVRLLFLIDLGELVAGVALGYFIRNQIYKKNWRDQVVTPGGYFTGNLILLAICEGASLFGLVVCILNGSFWPTVVPPALAVAVQLINFPHGKPMFPEAFPPAEKL